MGDGGDGLHLDGVHFLQRVVENTRRINGLESQVLVIEMADKQTLGSESVGLHINVCAGDAAQEAGLSNVGVSTDQEGSCVWVDRGQTTQVLSHLLQIDKRVLETPADGSHTTKGSTFELLALEERLGVFDQTDIVAGNGLNQVLRSRDLTERNAEVVGIVKRVHQILVWSKLAAVPPGEYRIGIVRTERMNILQSGKSIENRLELLAESLLSELDFSGIETCGRDENFSKYSLSAHLVSSSTVGSEVSCPPINCGKIPRIRLILNPDRICVGSRL